MEKTIRMPKKLLKRWLTALRSNRIGEKEITQATEYLHNGRGGYCCLGVLQVVTTGRIQRNEEGGHLPSMKWLERNGIEFMGEHGQLDDCPYLPSLGLHAAAANDNGETFAKIADAIEACAEGI